MGYLFLLIALLAGVTKGYCGKKTSGYTNSLRDATLANIIRMMLCILIGFILIFMAILLSQREDAPKDGKLEEKNGKTK